MQTLLTFEQARLDAEQAAKESAAKARAEAKRQEELDKLGRRVARDYARRQKISDQVALCGLYYYTRSPHNRAVGNYWRNCVRCGKPLQYYDSYEEAKAHNEECNRERVATPTL
jgi:hypothetical protein